MNQKRAGLWTSAVLAALTLAVFAAAQSAGPESAVRHYLQALQKGGVAQTAPLINTNVNSPYNLWLINQSNQVLGAPLRVRGKERSGNLVLVATDHEQVMQGVGRQERMVVTIFWVLVRRDGIWLIDPLRTYNYREQSSFLRR